MNLNKNTCVSSRDKGLMGQGSVVLIGSVQDKTCHLSASVRKRMLNSLDCEMWMLSGLSCKVQQVLAICRIVTLLELCLSEVERRLPEFWKLIAPPPPPVGRVIEISQWGAG